MLADCGTPSSQLGFFCSAVRAVTVESFEVFLAVKHCQDRQAQLQSAQCNNMFEVGLPSQSARSYWSHKSCFEQPYWARKLGSNRCGQVIGQAATRSTFIVRKSYNANCFPHCQAKTKEHQNNDYALLHLTFFFPVSATVSLSLTLPNSLWPANHLQTCQIRANIAQPISDPL